MRMYEINEVMKKTQKGSYIRVGYTTNVSSVKAEAKRQGIVVEKKTEKTVRLGCDYHNMKATIEAKENGRGTREMYEAPIIDNVLYENKKNGKLYLRVGTVPNDNANVVYLINGKEASLEEVKEVVNPSYFNNNKKGKPEVQNITLDNVYKLG